ncbi:motility protein A [Hydrogenothermus marinus]|uniref:Chemotaxis protein MotA n=1 Tax=Hydrogenothermus marinus TaxID=133270 RepID=A0A3M0BKB7_9AQUI|nr:motility protein A [Hydrogenothermus marinus]RMA97800.1 chemotaxis protein MotA [Hydrogenothermus marinus]
MDIATLIGIIAAFLLIIVSIVMGGSPMAFVNIPSILIVIGGGLSASLASYPLPEFIKGLKAIVKAFKPTVPNIQEHIDFLVNILTKVRKDGILSLEAEIDSFYERDPFFGDLMRMLVDGIEIEQIKENAEAALTKYEQDLSTEIAIWDALGELFPAFGMIGTLIGLIQMLQNLNDPSALGPGMAVAMITTLYGAVLANAFAIPITKKLKYYKDVEMIVKESYILTVNAIDKGTNPNLFRGTLNTLFGIKGGE